MNLQSLQELKNCESQELEFKQSLKHSDQGLEALCGMVNSNTARGTVWFGVRPDGHPVGVEEGDLDSAQRKLSQKLLKFDPAIHPTIEVAACGGRRLIRVSAARDRGVPFHEYDGRAFIREGSVTRVLSLREKQQLVATRDREKHVGPWKCDRCGSQVGQLMQMVVTDQGMTKSYQCDCGGEFRPVGWATASGPSW